MGVGAKYPSFATFFSLIMTSILCFLLFLAGLAFYISASYNYDSNGNVIKDDAYNTAQVWYIIYIVALLVSCTTFGIVLAFNFL
jgi:uncharacterized membrane protein YidH (DUF202 family)